MKDIEKEKSWDYKPVVTCSVFKAYVSPRASKSIITEHRSSTAKLCSPLPQTSKDVPAIIQFN